jgi:hypothetical protein
VVGPPGITADPEKVKDPVQAEMPGSGTVDPPRPNDWRVMTDVRHRRAL